MQTKSFQKYLTLVALSLLLSACGFQLRGTATNLAEAKIVLTHQQKLDGKKLYRDFEKQLKRALSQAGAEVISDVQKEAIQLNVMALSFSSQGVSRDATGRANEHEVTLRLDYQINKAIASDSQNVEKPASDGQDTIRSLSATASYYQDYRNPTAGRIQKKETHELLLTQLVQRLTRQLEFQLNN